MPRMVATVKVMVMVVILEKRVIITTIRGRRIRREKTDL
jgi:hypothetical protein